jgi:Mg2+ and Co2+ transporter CorA
LITDIAISYRENLNSIFELYIAGTSIQLNLVVNRLTGITLIVGIATVISGFYGMNFEQTWPSFDTPWGVLFVIFMIITLTVFLLVFLRRLKVF